jgi:tRNA nucleotidyltransferase (CCA-adding enzyme)
MIAMQTEIASITQQVLEKITPKQEDRLKIEALTKKLEAKVSSICQEQGIPAIVRVEGSVAKDTWLREDPDIDIFIRLPTSIPRKELGDVGLKIARKAAGNAKQIERFAEHPYLEIFVNSYRVDIVPCYNAKLGEWQSATDRTPFHTDYIKEHLSMELQNEVRLLKKFMQGIGVYGAEIKIGGFSGYLCELLVLKYKSFVEVLKAFSQYNQRVVIDIENYYEGRDKELKLLFPEPLVIVDPVDKGRNVASAVKPQKLYTFIGAARSFLKKPLVSFFFPSKPKIYSAEELSGQLEKHKSSTIFLVLNKIDAVPDVLWGQLYRTKRSLRKLLELNDFKVLKNAVWSNEKSLSVLVFELEQQVLPNIMKHLGPPLEREKECADFLSKYNDNAKVVSGPYISEERWIVLLPRKTNDAVDLLKAKLVDGGKNTGVAELIAKAFQKKLTILVNNEILAVYLENSDFAEFLSGFLVGKPFWLNPS